MRIGVDGFNLAMPRGTGVATYGRVLSQAITRLGHPVDVLYGMPLAKGGPGLLREVQFFDALDREGGRPAPKFGSTRWLRDQTVGLRPLEAATIPMTGQVETRSFSARLPDCDRVLNITELFDVASRYFRRWGRFLRVRVPAPVPDIMHWTYPLPLLLEGARNIYTMHDLVPLRLPYTTLDNKRLYLRLLRGCVQWGDHVCTVSEASRRDIMSILGVPADRVTNTYQASQMAPPPFEAATQAGLADWLGGLFGLQPGGYLLFFGALEPKKNLGRIIEAFLSSGLSMPLVLVGGRAWKAEGELRLIQPGTASAPRGERAALIRQLDYVPSNWLAGLMRGARAVVFPSLYEGFGLPVLEAMQAGTPVLTSTESSLPEVAGAAALLVDPYDTAAIGHAMRRLVSDDALCASLAAAGLEQAARFASPVYEGRLQALYDGIMAKPAKGSAGWRAASTVDEGVA